MKTAKNHLSNEKHLFLVSILAGFILIFLSTLTTVKAATPTPFNLTSFPDLVATAFSLTDFAAKLLVSSLILLFFTILTGVAFMKSNGNTILYAVLIVEFVVMGFLVALAWLPYWIFLIVCLLVAVLLAGQLRGFITGKGE